MAVFRILFYTGHPKCFTGFHINVIAARFAAPLPLKLHQPSAVEVQRSTGLR
jgi:hypothetical protein